MNATVEAAIARADAVVEAASADVVDPGTKPFTRHNPCQATALWTAPLIALNFQQAICCHKCRSVFQAL